MDKSISTTWRDPIAAACAAVWPPVGKNIAAAACPARHYTILKRLYIISLIVYVIMYSICVSPPKDKNIADIHMMWITCCLNVC